jgi:hypothetical protein
MTCWSSPAIRSGDTCCCGTAITARARWPSGSRQSASSATNALTMAETRGRAFASVRHSASMAERLEDVSVEALQAEIQTASDRSLRAFRAMAQRRLACAERAALLEELCGKPPVKAPPGNVPARRDLVDQRLAIQAQTDPLAGVARPGASTTPSPGRRVSGRVFVARTTRRQASTRHGLGPAPSSS